MTTTSGLRDIIDRVKEFCLSEGLLAGAGNGLHIAAAVSGGADSMALLRILLTLRAELGFELSACHVNHGIRGASADADEAFVRSECAGLGVPLCVFRAQDICAVPPHAGEDWARRLRYSCFERLCREHTGISKVATAHTCTDQAETLLFRLARGTGLHGAAGIRPERGVYIRPLLCISRAETEAVCTALGQRWVTDETNASDAYARNRIRRGALPALLTVNTAAQQNMALFCRRAAQADAYFTREAGRLLSEARVAGGKKCAMPAGARYALASGRPVWRLESLQKADELILSAAAHSLVSPVRDAEEKYVELLCGLVRSGSGAVQLTARVRFCAADGLLWRDERAESSAEICRTAQLFEPEKCAEYSLPGGYRLKSELIERPFEEKTQGVHKKDLKNEADYAKIATLQPAPVLRTRMPGDTYSPAGRGVSKELRKWMNEAGIPPNERDTLPLLACGSRVLWVCGAGFAQGLAPEAGGAQVLRLTVRRSEL